jgi:hypothetical protein
LGPIVNLFSGFLCCPIFIVEEILTFSFI